MEGTYLKAETRSPTKWLTRQLMECGVEFGTHHKSGDLCSIFISNSMYIPGYMVFFKHNLFNKLSKERAAQAYFENLSGCTFLALSGIE